MKTKSVLHRVDAHLAACAAVAGASLAVVHTSEAAIIYSGPLNILVPVTTAGIYLNVVTGVTGTSPAAVPGWDINPFSSSGLSWFAATPNATSGYIANFPGGTSSTLVDNLPFGALISSASTFSFNNASESVGDTAFHFNGNNNFVGFRFLNETGTTCYGWVQIHLGATFTDPARAIIGYAYESTGGAIGAPIDLPPDTPEPSTYALLSVVALGALGVRAWRRHKAG